MERLLIVPDLHLDATQELHPAYKLVKKFAKSFKPDGVVFLGDVLELEYIARFNVDNVQILNRGTFTKDYDLWQRELDDWQKVTSKIWIREGNHEERIARLLLKEPTLRGSVEIEQRCEYKKRGIEYATVLDPPTKIGHCRFIHGWYTNLHHAKKHVLRMGACIAYGHTHDVMSYSLKTLADDYEKCAWSLGCLCDTAPEWMKGRPTEWMHAFAVYYVSRKTGKFNMYPVRIFDNEFIWDGHLWR